MVQKAVSGPAIHTLPQQYSGSHLYIPCFLEIIVVAPARLSNKPYADNRQWNACSCLKTKSKLLVVAVS